MSTYLELAPLHKLRIFSPLEFRRLLSLSPTRTKYFLETYCRKGILTRLKKGLYSIKNFPPTQMEIANRLYQPSYVSYEYALQIYGLIPESAYTVTSATTKTTRVFVVDHISYSYTTLGQRQFTGYQLHNQDGVSTLIAEPEKALADYLYLVSLGKKAPLDRLAVDRVDREKLKSYEKMFNRRLSELI